MFVSCVHRDVDSLIEQKTEKKDTSRVEKLSWNDRGGEAGGIYHAASRKSQKLNEPFFDIRVSVLQLDLPAQLQAPHLSKGTSLTHTSVHWDYWKLQSTQYYPMCDLHRLNLVPSHLKKSYE